MESSFFDYILIIYILIYRKYTKQFKILVKKYPQKKKKKKKKKKLILN